MYSAEEEKKHKIILSTILLLSGKTYLPNALAPDQEQGRLSLLQPVRVLLPLLFVELDGGIPNIVCRHFFYYKMFTPTNQKRKLLSPNSFMSCQKNNTWIWHSIGFGFLPYQNRLKTCSSSKRGGISPCLGNKGWWVQAPTDVTLNLGFQTD